MCVFNPNLCLFLYASLAKSGLSLEARAHTHTVGEGGQNPAAFSYLLPIKSHVIWWLTLMGNG